MLTLKAETQATISKTWGTLQYTPICQPPIPQDRTNPDEHWLYVSESREWARSELNQNWNYVRKSEWMYFIININKMVRFHPIVTLDDLRAKTFFDDIIIGDGFFDPELQAEIFDRYYMLQLRKGKKKHEILHGHWFESDTHPNHGDDDGASNAPLFQECDPTLGPRRRSRQSLRGGSNDSEYDGYLHPMGRV